IEIHGNEQFHLGRNPALCQYTLKDPTISRQHLRIQCILYDQFLSSIAPFIYAANVSSHIISLGQNRFDRKVPMHPGQTFLLEDGDEIRISQMITLVFHTVHQTMDSVLTPMQDWERQKFVSLYRITGRLLGEGSFGKVLIAVNEKTGSQVACKVIAIKIRANANATRNEALKCFREFNVLEQLSHPNIISLEQVYWSVNNVYIFQELITGGDLFSYLGYRGNRLANAEAAFIIWQILKGIEYLHGQSITHRDLKPENILMSSLGVGARVVITDFGNARFVPRQVDLAGVEMQSQRMFSQNGTLPYSAPEIYQGNPTVTEGIGYSKSVDMWSIGCIAATILTGQVLFGTQDPRYEDPEKIKFLASECDLSIIDDEYHATWTKIDWRAKDLIKHLVVLDENARMTAAQALLHKWFTGDHKFDGVYQQAIEGWKPRRRESALIESLAA
ncbi:Pkinase-domain-containing protein, partial [Corynespora cassiicola Philippines]